MKVFATIAAIVAITAIPAMAVETQHCIRLETVLEGAAKAATGLFRLHTFLLQWSRIRQITNSSVLRPICRRSAIPVGSHAFLVLQKIWQFW